MDAIATEATPLDPSGVFLLDEIPTPTNAPKPYYGFSGPTLLAAIVQWANQDRTLDEVLREHHITRRSFYIMVERYPEVRNAHIFARKSQAPLLTAKTREMYHDSPPETAYEVGKDGNRRLSQGYVTWMRDKANINMRLAAVYETGTTVSQSKLESNVTSRNLNLNAELPKDVVGAALGIDDLLH